MPVHRWTVFVPTLAATALAALAFSPQSSPPAPPPLSRCARELVPPIELPNDPTQFDALTSDVIGQIELQVGASSEQGDVEVTVYSSSGLELVQGDPVFTDGGEGQLLVFEKLVKDPQWVQLHAVVQREDGEVFARHQIYGAQPSPLLPGAQIVDGSVTLEAQWE